ncbi:hypothetical protein EXU48_08080 [Occultella glacieicola]|uniref:Transposase n=1 Tax=Occultella glacieicola TaxID=2518684 RepID=A0ABY2E8Y0_9MICO|nr:hypothetical protein [Occultella glacieicola]TDE94747.1 hypothetical protein EXU48_08080 [Occultella glacieicola]
MRFTIKGRSHHLTPESVRESLAGRRPARIQLHWVAVAGLHWPVKQALELCTGLYRADFTTETARRIFQQLGFQVSSSATGRTRRRGVPITRRPEDVTGDAEAAWHHLATALLTPSLSRFVDDWESALSGRTTATLTASSGEVDGSALDTPASDQNVAAELIEYASLTRRRADRLSAVSTATAVALGLQRMLRPGERILEPPNLTGRARPAFDLTTTHRRAQFVLGPLTSNNTVRQRRAISSVVRLALDTSGTMRELWTSDPLFADFLRSTDETVEWGLSRSPRALREAFEDAYASTRMPVRTFVNGPASDVELQDLSDLVPQARLLD